MDLKKKKRAKPIKVLNDGFNEIIFKPHTKRVVIGINIHSWNGSRYRSFKCKTEDDAKKIGIEYVNKKSRKKI
jgi:hypothetical protein